jgi:hypothetical protein
MSSFGNCTNNHNVKFVWNSKPSLYQIVHKLLYFYFYKNVTKALIISTQNIFFWKNTFSVKNILGVWLVLEISDDKGGD